MTKVKVVICPYCGDTQPAGERCRTCGGLFEPLSRQATHNQMGPWFIRNEARPYQPGMSYETLTRMIERGLINAYSIVRGPTTKQFWTVARHTPGISHLLGYCHQCDAHVDPKDLGCPECGSAFGAYLDRNFLGLPDVKPMPWEAGAGDEDDAVDAGSAPTPRPAFSDLMSPDPRRPQTTGVSSFGSDDEIAGAGVGPRIGAATTPHVFGRRAGAGANGEDELSSSSSSSTSSVATARRESAADRRRDESSYAAVARHRSLQRRLARQERLVRVLAAMLVVTVIIAIAALFGLFRGAAGAGGGGTSEQNQSTPASAQPPQEDESLDDSGSAPGVSGNDGSTAGVVDEENSNESGDATDDHPGGSSDEPGNGSTAANDPAPNPWIEPYQRAQELVAQAAKDDLDLDARIAALKEAVSILREILADAAPDQRPAELEAEITRHERQLRKLELLKFFPDGPG